MIRRSWPSIFTSVPDHLPNSTVWTNLEIDRDQLAAFVAAAGADGDDLALRGLLFGGVGNDDAAGGFFLGIDALDDDAVVKRANVDGSPPK